jgi:RND superfamily putative drug exporter
MFFSTLGKVVVRFWPAILGVWVLAVVAGWTFAPAWEKVTRTGEVGFLPETSPSRRADRLFKEAFPFQYSAGNIALVFARQDGPLQEGDRAFVEKEVAPGLSEIALADEDTPVTSIRTLSQEGVGALLVSPDKKATIVLLELKTSMQEAANIPLLKRIETMLDDFRRGSRIPAGLEVGVTGSATAGRDLDLAEAAGAHTIERWTIAIVIVLLVLLYRAPLVAIIPLATVFVSVEVSMRFLGWLASTEIFQPSRELRVFVTVLAYGAGVDYCLFLIARYREELEAGAAPADALARSIARVGGAITASAAVVIGGIGMLFFASFGKISEAGLVIPLALTVALAGTLTFAAALLRLTGSWAFWPQRVGDASPATRKPVRWVGVPPRKNVWDYVGPFLVRRAGLVFVGTNLVLMPFVALGIIHSHDQNFNPLSDLPKNTPSRVANKLLTKHFPTGFLGPITVFIENEKVDFADPKTTPLIAHVTDQLRDKKADLGIVDVRSLTEPLGISAAALEKWKSLHGTKDDLEADIRAQALDFYVSQTKKYPGRVTRLDLTLDDDPLTAPGIASLNYFEKRIAELLPPELRGSRIAFAGATSSLRDLSTIKQGDQELIQWLVSGIVLVMLLIVLRRVVVSIYLVLSVLMSYLATLGMTDLLFRNISGDGFVGLDWKVPIFLFTILVAVGEDYNIFLLTRVKEEQDDFGPKDAIPYALSRTGQVITSCGFVMAGTFASLLSGSLQAMKELGFALAVGVLLDTLVVRPILVPTFLVLVQRIVKGPVGEFMALGHWKGWDARREAAEKIDETILHGDETLVHGEGIEEQPEPVQQEPRAR